MAITATSSVTPLPQLTALQAKQITEPPQVETAKKPTQVGAYASPVYKFDPLAKLSIELIRDTSTGSVVNQIPSEQVIQRYRLGLMTAPNSGANADSSKTSSEHQAAAALGAIKAAPAAAPAIASRGGSAAVAGASVSIRV